MPRNFDLTWDSTRLRWRKVHRGKVYVISCKELGAPPNKEGSYQAANAWWERKRAEIDGYLDQLMAAEIKQHRDELQHALSSAWRVDHLQRMKERYGSLEAFLAKAPALFTPGPFEPVVEERPPVVPIPEDLTIGGQVDLWLETLRSRVAAKRLSADRYDNVRDAVGRFRDFLGSTCPVAAINEHEFERYFYHLLGRVTERQTDPKAGMSEDTAYSYFKTAKQFIKHLYAKRLIELPRNLNDPSLRFRVEAKEVKSFTIDEVRTLVRKATGQLKLHILLSLNCGYVASDIAELRADEVDWNQGIIARKRTKTRDRANVPVVRYKLWPQTFDLLRKWGRREGTVLRTRSGGSWAFRRLRADGTLHKNDNVARNFNVLRGRLGLKLSFKYLRKTSPAILESHENYGRYVPHLLGHSPKGIAARNYTPPNDDLFDRILGWLGEQYGKDVTGEPGPDLHATTVA